MVVNTTVGLSVLIHLMDIHVHVVLDSIGIPRPVSVSMHCSAVRQCHAAVLFCISF